MEFSPANTDLNTLFEWVRTFGGTTLAGGVVLSLALLLLGAKLARVAVAAVGLVLGSVAATVLTAEHFPPAVTLGVVIGSGVAGFLLAILMFRVWMALSCAVILGLAVPMGCLAWTGAPPLQERAGPETGEDQMIKINAPDTDQADPDFQQQIRRILEQVRKDLAAHWKSLGAATHRTIFLTAALGCVIGLITGLIFPYLAASIQTSLIGAALLTACGTAMFRLNHIDLPGVLSSSRGLLITVGLITLLGLMLQWTILRRRADK